MWTYNQANGNLSRDGELVATGYSGADPEGKNNPAMEAEHDVGPIPRGLWRVATLTVGETPHGPYVLHLEPQEGTDTFGRGGFLIHGDSINAPGTASKGCVIMPRSVRERIWASGDREFQVV